MKVREHNHHIELILDKVIELSDSDVRWADNSGWALDPDAESFLDDYQDHLLDELDSIFDYEDI